MPTTTHHIKVTWSDGTSTEYTTTGVVGNTADTVTFTTSDGHAHEIQKKGGGVRDVETWDTTS